ncbi:hypothetical protein GWI33_018121 [Rhynchophorus ferrugineus]|uniref:Uncharacterized protein n=1 Tax=Rhynchophorus ferrugineus TaxID=354439 RepID=A0A834M5K4_RHYFE|nr:hypothetical protein GWI33_018121 [Rhynchophorus ferrugineus]
MKSKSNELLPAIGDIVVNRLLLTLTAIFLFYFLKFKQPVANVSRKRHGQVFRCAFPFKLAFAASARPQVEIKIAPEDGLPWEAAGPGSGVNEAVLGDVQRLFSWRICGGAGDCFIFK